MNKQDARIMREEDRNSVETPTEPCAIESVASHTHQDKNSQLFLPEGHVAIATIAAPTNENGKTALQFSADVTQLFDIIEAIGSQSFNQQDVGKRVACIRVSHTEQIMIMGFIFEGEANNNKKLLDQLVAHTNLSNPLSTTQQDQEDEIEEEAVTSVFTQENSVLDDTQVFNTITSSPESLAVTTDTDDDLVPKQIVLKAQEEITLQCGESYLTLKSDGRIKLNGKHIHSRATKVQRLSGGSIKLN